MQYIRGDRECGILLWFLSQYCNFGCFQSKTPLTNLFPEKILEKYALEHGYTNFKFYVDDGISGTTFAGVR